MKVDILCEQHYGEYGGDSYSSRIYESNVEIKDINGLFCVLKEFMEKQLKSYNPDISERGFDVYECGTLRHLASIWLLTKSITFYIDEL